MAVASFQFEKKITLGNIILLATIIAGGIVALTELKANDRYVEARLLSLEEKAKRVDIDRERIIQIDENVKIMKSQLERLQK